MSTDSSVRPSVSSASSAPPPPLFLPAPLPSPAPLLPPTPLPLPAPPPSEHGASWWGPAFEPRDEAWPLRYVPLPSPPAPRWRWRWSPWIGIAYGPIPVGLIALAAILLALLG